MPAVRVENLVKRYGHLTAVDGISFEVAAGEIFALLGPNGAGKTTIVEILEGYRKPDAGLVTVLGFDPATQGDRIKPRTGVMLQEGGLYPAIRPREALGLFAHFYPRSRSADELIDLLGLRDALSTPYRRLSGGQRQRLRLALALIGCPDLLFLDEPTAGLDPQARRAAWDLIGELRKQGSTILLTTHYLEEAERLADRVAIIDHGRLVALDSPQALLRGETSVVRLRTLTPLDVSILDELPSARRVRQEDGAYLLDTGDAATLLVEVTTVLRDRDIPLLDLRVGPGSLEDVFLQLTGGQLEA